VRFQVDDVCVGGRVRDRATVIQRKTGRPVQFEITEPTRTAIRDCLANTAPGIGISFMTVGTSRHDNMLGSSTIGSSARISIARLTERTQCDEPKRAQIYKKTGNLRAVQLLLGHTKLESTVRYLGIEVDDALTISEQVEL
jgi:hypothetical protein